MDPGFAFIGLVIAGATATVVLGEVILWTVRKWKEPEDDQST